MWSCAGWEPPEGTQRWVGDLILLCVSVGEWLCRSRGGAGVFHALQGPVHGQGGQEGQWRLVHIKTSVAQGQGRHGPTVLGTNLELSVQY